MKDEEYIKTSYINISGHQTIDKVKELIKRVRKIEKKIEKSTSAEG